MSYFVLTCRPLSTPRLNVPLTIIIYGTFLFLLVAIGGPRTLSSIVVDIWKYTGGISVEIVTHTY